MLAARAGRRPAASVPPPIAPAEHAELEAARSRFEAKWAALDELVADFRGTDQRLARHRFRLRHP